MIAATGRQTRREFLRHATAGAMAASLLPLTSTAGTPGFHRTPNVQNLGPRSGAVVWALPVSAACSVLVTDTSGNSTTFPASMSKFEASATGLSEDYYQYRAMLSGLEPGMVYTCQIQADGQPVAWPLRNPLQFRTTSDGPFAFLHFADSGDGGSAQEQLSLQMGQEDVSLVLANGDLAYDLATYTSIEANYYGVYREQMARVPFFTTLGNHEYYTDSGKPSLAGRVTPTGGVPARGWGRYYSFDWGNAHFVALDSNLPLDEAIAGTGEMLQWLENDLRNTRKFWRIVFFHHPGFATGKHQDEPEAAKVRNYLVPILEKYGVQLVFNGHEHTYQRTFELRNGKVVPPNSGGIVYVTSGGGGAPTYWNAPNELIAQSIGVNHYVRAEVSGPGIRLRVRGLGSDTDIDTAVLAPQPQILGEVVNVASYLPELASGSPAAIFGRNLCPSDLVASLKTPMLSADGCTVTLNGNAIPLLYAGYGQINVQIPFGFSGQGTLTVQTPNGSVETSIRVKKVAPALFPNPDTPALAFAWHGDGSLIDASSPARPLEQITLAAVGLGDPNGAVPQGILPSEAVPLTSNILVMFGNDTLRPDSVALSRHAVGVYEVQVRVPSGIAGSVRLLANDTPSNALMLAAGSN
jgi:uncharacterized protein (TIGR03437 family)